MIHIPIDIAMVVVDRANWGRLAPLASAIRDDEAFNLTLICGGTTVLQRFKAIANDLERDGYQVVRVYHEMEGNTHATMAQSIGMGVTQYTTALEQVTPDFVLIIGDRYEALSAAIAAAYTNRCIVHLQGGEVSGSIDESARHAITKLAHYHCPATARARDNIIAMGERVETVLSVGCPSSDVAVHIKRRDSGRMLVVYHPNTCESSAVHEISAILGAVEYYPKIPTTIFWPNVDAGSDAISKLIRQWRSNGGRTNLEYVTNVEPHAYQQMLADAAVCVGNSSSFVRDSSFYGTPVVLVGNRQDGRECGDNVTRCNADMVDIVEAIRVQCGERYPRSTLYGDGRVSGRIVDALKIAEPYVQKRLAYHMEFVA